MSTHINAHMHTQHKSKKRLFKEKEERGKCMVNVIKMHHVHIHKKK